MRDKVYIYSNYGSTKPLEETYSLYSNQNVEELACVLLQNLVLRKSNAIVYLGLTQLRSDTLGIFISKLCYAPFISTRSVYQFSNTLLWQIYLDFFIFSPKSMYEGRYSVLFCYGNGIYCRSIYAFRPQELIRLSKSRRIIILLLEIKDFILPRVYEILNIVGKLFLNSVNTLILQCRKILSTNKD